MILPSLVFPELTHLDRREKPENTALAFPKTATNHYETALQNSRRNDQAPTRPNPKRSINSS